MPIFIAKTYDGVVENIVLAKNKELAHSYWQGNDVFAHSVQELNESSLDHHPTGVLPILGTKEITTSIGLDRNKTVRIIKML